MKALVCAVAACLWIGATRAQDDTLDDYEKQDRRYQDTRTQREAQPPPPPDRAGETAAFLARAEELIRDPQYRSDASERYRVQTNDPRVDVSAVVTWLDRFRAEFDEFWDGRLALRPYDKLSRVFLFYSFYEFNQLLVGDWRFHVTRPQGHYRPWFDVITIHSDPGGGESLAETLVHEAAHQLLEQRVFGGQAPPAIWLSEGLACYFGFSLFDESGLRPGLVGRKPVVLLKSGEGASGTEARARLKEFTRSARGEDAPEALFSLLLDIRDPGVFYGSEASDYYTASWLLVHFLLHGDDGAHAAAFASWLGRAAEEEQLDGTGLLQALGLTPAELDSAAAAHARRLAR